MKTKFFGKRSIVSTIALLVALTFSPAFVFERTPAGTAYAASKDEGKWIAVKEIFDDKAQTFDHDNLLDLFEALTGERSFNAVKAAARSIKTSMDFRTVNDGSNIVVTFGGLKWDAVYLTTTSDDGDVILDLWRSSDGLWGYWGVTESNKATFSKDGWGTKSKESTGKDKYPANMYSTSLIRVKNLNAGGNIAIDKDHAISHEQDETNQYARFTMEGDGGLVNGKPSLTEYIATPAQVGYQENEWNEATAESLLTYWKYYASNEAYGTPREGGRWYSDSDYSLQDGSREENEKYGAWQNDYLWLPSYSETGDDNKNRDGEYGIWETDTYLLSNPSSYAWLRSAYSSTTNRVIGLDGGGGWDDQYISNDNWVRPALHLNLTKAVATTLFEDSYAIEYDVNGGTGSIPKEYHMTDERIALATGDRIERTGCVFLGWSERDNGGAIIDSLAAETAARVITSLTLTRAEAEALPDRTKTLYAMWAEDKNGNGIADYRETGTIVPELSVVVFGDETVEYDGEPHRLGIEGSLPEGFTVAYSGDRGYDDAAGGATEPGVYTVTATFSQNGEEVASKIATLTITKKKYDMAGVTFEDSTVPWDGARHSLSVDGLPVGVSVAYSYSDGYTYGSTDGAIEPGTYSVTATFTVDGEHYEVPMPLKAVLTITKTAYDMSGVTFADQTFKYDGAPHDIFIRGNMPAGVHVSYSGNGRTEVGEYEVWAMFTGDEEHYEPISPMKATLTVEDSGRGLQGITFEDETVPYDGNVHSIFIKGTPAEGISVTYENNGQSEPGVYTVTAKFADGAGEFAKMTATLTVLKARLERKDGNGNTTLVVDSEDGFDPTWELAIDEEDGIVRAVWAWENDSLSQTCTLKLLKDGSFVPFDGKVTVRLLIPQAWRDRDFTLRSAEDGEIEYMRDGDYVVFEADGLSAYSFTMDGIAYLPILLAAGGASLLCMGALTVLSIAIRKNKKGE